MENSNSTRKFHSLPILMLMILGLFVMLRDWNPANYTTDSISYSQFLDDLSQGKIEEVAIGSTRIIGTFKNSSKNQKKEFMTQKVEDPTLTQRLEDSHVKFSGMTESGPLGAFLSWTIPLFIFILFWSFILRRSQGMGQGPGFLSLGRSKAKIYVETDLKTRFEDVAGVDEAKGELREIVDFLKDPLRYSKLGGRMPKGVLLIGPPGTGKTLLARAVAGEASVPFFSINGSEFVELFVGLGAARVRDLFQQARNKAPCIIFIDELDALGKARGINALTGSSNDEKEQTLNQLLAEMDGFDASTGVILLAATNRPEVLDPALLRAGRFDRQVLVDKPDKIGREQILKIHLRKIKLAGHVDLKTIAAITVGFSGADLANLANEAALIATRRGAEQVENDDFTAALERIVAGLERKTRLLNSEEKRRVAYHEMGHALVALALGESEIVHKVSIIPRGISALGYTLRRPIEDRYLLSKRELETKITIALAGRASEMIFFNDISTGAGDDLDKATEIARAMVTRYGMDSSVGLVTLEREPAPTLGGQSATRVFDYGERMADIIDKSVKNLMNTSLDQAIGIISHYQPMIEEAVQLLLSKETLDENELKNLWIKHRKNPSSPIRDNSMPIKAA